MSKQSRDTVNTAIIAHGDAELDRLRERVRVLEGALREAKDYANLWPIGCDNEPQEQRGGARDTMVRNISDALANLGGGK